jgi:hypothetical protein
MLFDCWVQSTIFGTVKEIMGTGEDCFMRRLEDNIEIVLKEIR